MEIGRKTNVASTGLSVDAKVTMGNYCSVAPNCTFAGRTQHACIAHPELVSTFQLDHYPPCESREHIVVGSDVWIGRNAVILGGVTIGHGAIIGAFSVVTKNVHPYAIVGGNPAKVIRYRFGPKQIEKLLKIAWWEWDDETIKARAADLARIDVFLETYSDFHPDIERVVRFAPD